MIDWKRRALELAEVVNHGSFLQALSMAKELLDLGKRETKAQQKFTEHWRCPDKKTREKLYSEYLEMIR